MRAAILGPLSFLIVPSLLWPAEMADIAIASLQGAALGVFIGLAVGVAWRAA